MKKSRNALIYWVSLAVSAALFLLVAFNRDLFDLTERTEILSALCDAFFVPGALMVCIGLLSLSAKEGIFDMLGYGFKSLLVLFAPFGKPKKHKYYYDYKQEKAAKRGKMHPGPLMIGIAFLLLAGVCLVFYYHGA